MERKINTHIIIFQRYQAQLHCDSVEWNKQEFKNQFEYCENKSNATSFNCLKSHPFEYVYMPTRILHSSCRNFIIPLIMKAKNKRENQQKKTSSSHSPVSSSVSLDLVWLFVFSVNADAFKMYKPSSAEYLICALYKYQLTFTMPKIACLG